MWFSHVHMCLWVWVPMFVVFYSACQRMFDCFRSHTLNSHVFVKSLSFLSRRKQINIHHDTLHILVIITARCSNHKSFIEQWRRSKYFFSLRIRTFWSRTVQFRIINQSLSSVWFTSPFFSQANVLDWAIRMQSGSSTLPCVTFRT